MIKTWCAVFLATLLSAFAVQADAIRVTFMGNTTLAFDDGDTTILTDGFLSRLGAGNYLLGTRVKTDTDRVDDALDHAGLNTADAIFVAHAHFDHAMDAGYVGKRLNAHVYGSRSTRAVAVATGVTRDDVTLVEDFGRYPVGGFTVTTIYSPHGDPNRFPGELRTGFQLPARMRDYLANENYSFLFENGAHAALVVPGGNYLAGKLAQIEASTVFLGIGGLNSADRKAAKRDNPGFIETYWHETVTAVGAKTVIPIHWDNFFKELKPGVPFDTPPKIIEDFDAAKDRLEALARANGVCLHWMTMPFDTITLDDPKLCGD